MTTDFITSVAQSGSNQWSYILPEILLGGLALLLLVFEIVFPKTLKRAIPVLSIIGQLAILAVVVCSVVRTDAKAGEIFFYDMLWRTPTGQFMRLFFIVTSIMVHALAMISLPKQRVPRTEFFHIVLVITAAMMLLAQSGHFLMLFVALETVTVGFYILVSYYRTSAFSLEAGLKYLVLGALSSGLLLFGIVLLYGMVGAPQAGAALPVKGDPLSFARTFFYLAANPGDYVANIGLLLVLGGVAFKIGLVPFQIWIPDVYQGAPTPVTAFLSVGSKAAGFAVLIILVAIFSPCMKIVSPFLTVMTFATIIFGNLAALTQHNVKRLIGLSGVSHAGFIMIGLLAAIADKTYSLTTIFVYLIAYALASFVVFGVMAFVAGENDAEQELSDYHNLSKRSPFLAAMLTIGIGSLAGIPPLFGFMSKLLVFISAFRAELYALLAVAILAVVVSIYYYFTWIRAAFFKHWQSASATEDVQVHPADMIRVPFAMKTLMLVLALATLLLGVYQKPLMDLLVLLRLA